MVEGFDVCIHVCFVEDKGEVRRAVGNGVIINKTIVP